MMVVMLVLLLSRAVASHTGNVMITRSARAFKREAILGMIYGAHKLGEKGPPE